MPPLNALALYVPVALLMAVTPGPATLFVLSRASAYGARAGLLSAAGLLIGTLVLVSLAAVGLTGILAAAPIVFDVVKSAGAAYLIYLGLRTVLISRGTGRVASSVTDARPGGDSRATAPDRLGMRLFRDAVVTELSNPKAALFYASVLPQFVDPHRADVPLQMFVLGSVFVVFGACSLSLIAVFAGALQARLRAGGIFGAVIRWASGGVLVALGLRLASLPRD